MKNTASLTYQTAHLYTGIGLLVAHQDGKIEATLQVQQVAQERLPWIVYNALAITGLEYLLFTIALAIKGSTLNVTLPV
jgi:hypothetical protein